jgi:DNA-directed RNA polymerase subunit RPC12/RpoP
MRKLYEAADLFEAQILKDYLQEQGIATLLFSDSLSGAAGVLPVNIYPTLWLEREEQYRRARCLINEFLQPKLVSETEGWRCPACGKHVDPGFDLCWNCATPRV